MTPPRVRFAPSPTGFLHVGGARTALYNWLFARSRGGTMILRSDDTDRERSTAEYAADILDSMRWLGLDWDEGIAVGGPHGSYRQSERFGRYREIADRLVAEGWAYHSFATDAQLNAFRGEARAAGTAPSYDGRAEPEPEEAARRVAAGDPAPIRFRVPRPGTTTFIDLVRGEVTFDHSQVDDFVILRSDGTPTYHLASTVDDVDYDITHVVRGEDLLSSTPKHILLTEALGRDPVSYAHLSLLMGPDGAKLSKRHGHTAIAAYRAEGYLAAAMTNYLALLGWSPGDGETIVDLQQMVDRFDLSAVSKNPAIFDAEKLLWMNGVYIRELGATDFRDRAVPALEEDLGRTLTAAEAAQVLAIGPHVQERTKLMTEVPGQIGFLLVDPPVIDEVSWEKIMTVETARIAVEGARAALGRITEWTTPGIEKALRGMLDSAGLSARKGLQPVRVALSGSAVSPPLFESIEVLGRERTLRRLDAALDRLDA